MKNNRLPKQMAIILSIFLLAVNGILGVLLTNQSKNSLQDQMRKRMLDIANSAAALIDGDTLEKLQKEDVDTEPYQHELGILRTFQEQVELRYIYGIRDMGDKTFTFTIDPAVYDPGEFGEPIMYTDALYAASLGTPSVDKQPYKDKWGRFYSAYSPVFNSAGKVAGIIAVDIDADWYDEQLRHHIYLICIACGASLIAGGFIVFLITGRLRKRFIFLNSEMTRLAGDVEELASELHLVSETEQKPEEAANSGDDFTLIESKLKFLREELQNYITEAHSMAYTDSLTGLGNRNAYTKTIKRLNTQIVVGTADFSVAVFDINGLKLANDKFGHEFGDLMITTVSDILKDTLNTNMIYRIGGDEFVAILGNSDEHAFDQVFDSIKQRLDEMGNVLRDGEKQVPLGVSKGAAYYIKDSDTDIKAIFHRADEAMYADKAAWYTKHGDRRKR